MPNSGATSGGRESLAAATLADGGRGTPKNPDPDLLLPRIPAAQNGTSKTRPEHFALAVPCFPCFRLARYAAAVAAYLQPRQRRPEPSPRRKPWESIKNRSKAPAGAKEPWHGYTGHPRLQPMPTPTTGHACIAAARRSHPSFAPTGAFQFLCPSTHGLRRGLGSAAAAAAKKERPAAAAKKERPAAADSGGSKRDQQNPPGAFRRGHVMHFILPPRASSVNNEARFCFPSEANRQVIL